MRFTFDGNPAAEQVISQHQNLVILAVRDVVPDARLAAIVMIGGYGREEGAYVVDPDGTPQPYNDYDYFVVFRNTSKAKAHAYCEAIADLEHETGIEVDFFPLLEEEIPKLPFSLMNAEMRAGHAVIWGESNVLAPMPAMPLSAIPMIEFYRLLTNRGCLLLMNRMNPDRRDHAKFINKAWLAIGDTALASAGHYELSYQAKRDLAARVLNDPTLIANYQRAIDIRLRPDQHEPWLISDMKAVVDAWELAMHTLAPRLEQPRSLPAMLGNLARHLRDPRLPTLDAMSLKHPRMRISASLPTLLRIDEPALLLDAGHALLDVWGSYS